MNNFGIKKLVSLDILNKYILKNCYIVPKISRISFKVFLDEFNLLDNENKEQNKKEILKIKIYVMLYIYLSGNPILKNQFIKGLKQKIDLEKYYFNIIIKENFVNLFLFELFFNLRQKNIFNININNNKKKRIDIRMTVSLEQIFEFSNFLSLNLKDKTLFLDFEIKNDSNIIMSKDAVENFSLFWLSKNIL